MGWLDKANGENTAAEALDKRNANAQEIRDRQRDYWQQDVDPMLVVPNRPQTALSKLMQPQNLLVGTFALAVGAGLVQGGAIQLASDYISATIPESTKFVFQSLFGMNLNF